MPELRPACRCPAAAAGAVAQPISPFYICDLYIFLTGFLLNAVFALLLTAPTSPALWVAPLLGGGQAPLPPGTQRFPAPVFIAAIKHCIFNALQPEMQSNRCQLA